MKSEKNPYIKFHIFVLLDDLWKINISETQKRKAQKNFSLSYYKKFEKKNPNEELHSSLWSNTSSKFFCRNPTEK